MNPGGQREDSDLHSHSKITGLLHKFRIYGPLSEKPKGRGKPRARRKKNERGEEDGNSLILFNRDITQSQFCP
jgi:hypothetical protein